jgi:hypothetical protein
MEGRISSSTICPGMINLSLTASTGRYTVSSEIPDECGFCGKSFPSFDDMLDDIGQTFSSWSEYDLVDASIPTIERFSPRIPTSFRRAMTVIATMTWITRTPIKAAKVAETKRKRPQVPVVQVKGKDRMDIRIAAHLTKVVADVVIRFPSYPAEPIGSHASGYAKTSVTLERYLNEEEEPVEL